MGSTDPRPKAKQPATAAKPPTPGQINAAIVALKLSAANMVAQAEKALALLMEFHAPGSTSTEAPAAAPRRLPGRPPRYETQAAAPATNGRAKPGRKPAR